MLFMAWGMTENQALQRLSAPVFTCQAHNPFGLSTTFLSSLPSLVQKAVLFENRLPNKNPLSGLQLITCP